MAKTWVLDTETKGTGAHVVPLSDRAPRAERPLAVVQLARPPHPPRAPREEPAQRRFKLVDVRASRVLGEDLDTRGALAQLAEMSSSLDARVYARTRRDGRWRLLTLAETRALWELATREQFAGASTG